MDRYREPSHKEITTCDICGADTTGTKDPSTCGLCRAEIEPASLDQLRRVKVEKSYPTHG